MDGCWRYSLRVFFAKTLGEQTLFTESNAISSVSCVIWGELWRRQWSRHRPPSKEIISRAISLPDSLCRWSCPNAPFFTALFTPVSLTELGSDVKAQCRASVSNLSMNFILWSSCAELQCRSVKLPCQAPVVKSRLKARLTKRWLVKMHLVHKSLGRITVRLLKVAQVWGSNLKAFEVWKV